jgi:toxin ParE1/3/4
MRRRSEHRGAVPGKVVYTWKAEEDLAAIFRSIAPFGRKRAREHLRSIEDRCASLAAFPYQGRSRDDLLPGIRVITYARSAVIAYRVFPEGVRIDRVFWAGQDYENLLRDERD